MHIKQITLYNFRSFKEQPEIHPFSPGTNSVVGRNGSGKSNLFDAVQFCLLAPRFYTLRAEERQALLHEGSGSTAVSAFVEIVFCNLDHRFSLENSDEVVLRRTVGHKKDEFFLQRKRATKNEIMSLLEGAGFSKSNPYYIVQQGKVNALCTMNDGERLRLLKEVAGTTVYDEKKTESLTKMTENQSNIDKIDEILETIETRLDELRGEKDELTSYQSLDKERRAMEYCLYDLELTKSRSTLDAIESDRNVGTDELAELHDICRQTHDAIRSTEARLKQKSNSLRRSRMQLADLLQDETRGLTEKTRLSLECKELQESVKTGNERLIENQELLKKVEAQIGSTKKLLEQDVTPKYDAALEELQRLENEGSEAGKQLEGLYAKQGRGKQFGTKVERNAYLQEHVTELASQKTEKETSLTASQDSLGSLRRSVADMTKSITTQEASLEKKNTTSTQLVKAIAEKKRQRLELHDARKQHWRDSQQLSESAKEAKEALHAAQSAMRKSMPRATAMGLEALKDIVQQEGLQEGQQYFGMLMDNFELTDAKYQTAVEVAAQNSLFHVIVDTDGTAARLMKRLEADKLGRVTFLPLSKLQVENVHYPESADVKPLMQVAISYDKIVDRAMRHVFGKKLVAKSMDVAGEWSGRCRMDAITLDGDLCSRKGALSGGYVDNHKSRLRAHGQYVSAKNKLREAQQEDVKIKKKALEVDQSITNIMAELQRLEAKHADLEHNLTTADQTMTDLQSKLESAKTQVSVVEKTTIPTLEHEIESISAHMERLEAEKKTDLTSRLSSQDRELLASLKKSQKELLVEIENQNETVSQLTVERQRLESTLQDNLLKKRKELLEDTMDDDDALNRRSSRGAPLSAAVQEQKKEDLLLLQRELQDAIRLLDDIEVKLVDIRKVEASLKAELIDAKNEFEKLKTQDMKNSQALDTAQTKTEKLLNRRSMIVSKKETYQRKIQELGSLPPPTELAKFNGLTIAALMRDLDKVNKKLKKYSHVNKKAYDQFVNFSEQRETLLTRKEELDQGAEKVKELIESLDRQKDEAINRTFRGVSAHFKDVFKELVPHGAGELIMKTALDGPEEKDDKEKNDDDTDDEAPSPEKAAAVAGGLDSPDVSLYRGIGIKIRFSNVGENYLMSQLSGGQKALVAMALIFAIQRCDPAPFYLFDELDQALDSTHRKSVASLIERQANHAENPTQFIFSTFRPELVSIANRCYGISHQNKVSSILHLSKKDALHFVANLQKDEEAVGEVTSLATASRRSKGTTKSTSRKRKAVVEEAVVEEEDESIADEESVAVSAA